MCVPGVLFLLDWPVAPMRAMRVYTYTRACAAAEFNHVWMSALRLARLREAYSGPARTYARASLALVSQIDPFSVLFAPFVNGSIQKSGEEVSGSPVKSQP